MASALRSLWAGFNLCFLLWALCSHVNTRVQGYVLVHGFITYGLYCQLVIM